MTLKRLPYVGTPRSATRGGLPRGRHALAVTGDMSKQPYSRRSLTWFRSPSVAGGPSATISPATITATRSARNRASW
jgi:hypothetical protein